LGSSDYLASLDDNSSFRKKVGEESNVLQGAVPNILKKMKLESNCSQTIRIHQSDQRYNLERNVTRLFIAKRQLTVNIY
jgi:hypothetical protein